MTSETTAYPLRRRRHRHRHRRTRRCPPYICMYCTWLLLPDCPTIPSSGHVVGLLVTFPRRHCKSHTWQDSFLIWYLFYIYLLRSPLYILCWRKPYGPCHNSWFFTSFLWSCTLVGKYSFNSKLRLITFFSRPMIKNELCNSKSNVKYNAWPKYIGIQEMYIQRHNFYWKVKAICREYIFESLSQ